jgi:hypothetical protein
MSPSKIFNCTNKVDARKWGLKEIYTTKDGMGQMAHPVLNVIE